MVKISENILVGTDNELDFSNPNLFIFIDDNTKNNKLILMVFDTYMPNTITDYFKIIGPNVAMINEDMSLSSDLLEEIQYYRHLKLYQELEKP